MEWEICYTFFSEGDPDGITTKRWQLPKAKEEGFSHSIHRGEKYGVFDAYNWCTLAISVQQQTQGGKPVYSTSAV